MIYSFINIITYSLNILVEFSNILLWSCGLIFFTVNAMFLYVLSGKFLQKCNSSNLKWLMFDIQYKWLKPNTLFLPFEFHMALCNYFLWRVSIFGYGFDSKIKWLDVVNEVIDDNGANISENIKKDNQKTTPPKLKII